MPTLPAYNPVPVTNDNVATFITTDPYGLGLAAIRTANPGQDGPLETAVNPVSSAYPLPGNPITAAALLDLVDATEFSTMTTAQLSQLQTILSTQTILVGGSASQAKLNALLANYPKSLTAVKATYSQNGSPWQYYFGVGTQATTTILDNARNSPPGNRF